MPTYGSKLKIWWNVYALYTSIFWRHLLSVYLVGGLGRVEDPRLDHEKQPTACRIAGTQHQLKQSYIPNWQQDIYTPANEREPL